MNSHRISVKYFINDPSALKLADFTPIFHSWIQKQQVTDHLLVDIADYKHVHHGPGIILIAHEADFGIDLANGRPGLLYTRKRSMAGDLRQQLPLVFRNAIKAARLIEAEPSLDPPLTFRSDEVQLTFLDRLRVPNTLESFETLRSDVEAVLAEFHPGATINVVHADEDARRPLSLRIHVEGAADLAAQLEHLERVHA